jgi:hypothetical protein
MKRKQDGQSVFTLLSNLRTLEETMALVLTRLMCSKHARCWRGFSWRPASAIDLYLKLNPERNIWYSVLVKRMPTRGETPSSVIPVHEAIFPDCVQVNYSSVLEYNDDHISHSHRANGGLPENQKLTALTHFDRRPGSIIEIIDVGT